jgi:hypothetical protein
LWIMFGFDKVHYGVPWNIWTVEVQRLSNAQSNVSLEE